MDTIGTALTGQDGWFLGEDQAIIVNAIDGNGDPLDVSAATAIEFYVANYSSGVRLISKTLGSGIAKGPAATQYTVALTDGTDDLLLTRTGQVWYESYVTLAGARRIDARNWLDIHPETTA